MPDTIRTADRVRELIAGHLCVPLEKATDDADLIDDLGADSLDPVEFSMAIEDEFGVTLTDNTVERWRTVGDVIASVEGQR